MCCIFVLLDSKNKIIIKTKRYYCTSSYPNLAYSLLGTHLSTNSQDLNLVIFNSEISRIQMEVEKKLI